MNTGAVIAVSVAAFIYMELAIGFGYYMFILTSRKMQETDQQQKKQIRKYSIIAGAVFPITFAIIIANKVAGKG